MREAQAPHEIASITCTASEALAPKFPPKENTLADNMHRIALHLSISYAHFRPRANKVYPRRISQHGLTSAGWRRPKADVDQNADVSRLDLPLTLRALNLQCLKLLQDNMGQITQSF
jgi:hypothetical protein